MTASTSFGEFGLPRYIKMPTPGGSAPFGDGWPHDAGTMMIVDNNVSWLVRESCRHWVSTWGPGAVDAFQTTTTRWTGFSDLAPPSTSGWTTNAWQLVPWTPRDSRVLGPFPGICDRPLDGGITLRTVHVSMDVRVAASDTVTGVFALTSTPSRESLFEGNYLAITTTASTGPGQSRLTGTLSSTMPLGLGDTEGWPCRAGSSSGRSLVAVVPVWLWFGWQMNGPNTGCAINGLSAWEVR